MLLHRVLAMFLIVVAVATGVAFAHEGVKNKAVMARMEGMKSMGQATRVLVRMARGEVAFDPAAADAAKATLILEAQRTPALFEAREDDPMSEAKDAIWTDFGDFSRKAQAMETVAAAADLSSLTALRGAVAEINRSCGACHDLYRE